VKPQSSRAKLESLSGGRFRVSGVLDAVTVADLLNQSIDRFRNQSSLEIDLAGVSEGDSAGLALLIEWMRIAKDANQTLVFHNVPGQVSALARISEVEDLLFATNNATSVQAAATA
jgi:phospholipid transport system transporter-binding protein